MLAAVLRLVETIGGVVHAVGVLRGEEQRLRAIHPHVCTLERDRGDVLHLARRQMRLADDVAAGAVNHVGVFGIWHHIAIFDDAYGVPFAIRDFAVVAPVGDADRAAFLLAGTHPVGKRIGDADVIELRRGLVEP